ncbi:MAG: DNA translocase FtsK [Oscillibacter sp.]|nr:DNA translocase FtsK [Oscillibacter sp.]
MAASQQKKKTAKKTTRSTKAAQPQQRPIRREIWGIVLLVLMLCVAVSYFGIEAIFIDWFAKLIKGLIGYGYWLTGPSLLLAALILLFHHGRPVRLRVTCSLMLPVLFGALCHMVFAPAKYTSSIGILKTLWISGVKLESGGAISGTIAVGSIAVFSKVASIIIFTALLVVLLMISFRLTVGALIEKSRNRPQYEEEPELEMPVKKEPAIRMVPIEEPKRIPAVEKPKAVIDIPLDDEPLGKTAAAAQTEKKRGLLNGFFRQKADHQQTPDQLLEAKPASQEEKTTPVVEAVPTVQPQTTPPSVMREPAAEPAVAEPFSASKTPEIATPAKTAAAAAAVAAATAEVSQEIEQGKSEEQNFYQYPPITLLDENHQTNVTEAGAELRNNSRRLSETLSSFGVDAKPGDVVHGPTVTRYEFVLDQGVKLSKITNLADDIALALGASGVRIAPIPDKISVVGIEVPNKQVSSVLIRDVLESRAFTEHKSNVAFALGKDIAGNCIIGNIGKLPHVLIAGTTGSGKSVCTNSLIVSLMYKSSPEDVRFIMVDPKMVELAPYNGIPHLLIPVVTDPKKAAGALQWAVFEMMKRYKLFSENNVKDLKGYNALAKTSEGLEHLPSVVVVIDELADLMLVAAKEVEESICRVAQMGRAAGVHLVIATQRPSADVITGIMKANIPSRIAFAVASSLESRIILDTQGAEKLIGRGDMLYFPLGAGKPTRVQGCFISPEEIERVVEFAKQSGEAHYSDEVMQKIDESVQEKEKGNPGAGISTDAPSDDCDELLPAAVDVILETGQASVSMLQRRLKLGYSRAARLVDQMEERGIVGPFEGSKPRTLLITKEQWQEMQMAGQTSVTAVAPSDGESVTDDSVEENEIL